MDNGGVRAVQAGKPTGGPVIDLREGATSVAVPWGPQDPAPRRQVQVPTLLSFAGDCAATLVGVTATAAMLPWAPQPGLAKQALIAAVCLLAFAVSGLYNRPRLAEPATEMLAVLRGVLTAVGGLLLTAVMFEAHVERSLVVLGTPPFILCLAADRIAIRAVARRLQTRGLLGVTTLVAGANDEARTIARTINRTGWLGYHVAGFIWTEEGPAPDVCDGLPVVGSMENLDDTLHAIGARAIVIATSAVAVQDLPRLVDLADDGIEIRTTAAFRGTAPGRVAVDSLDGIPLVAVRRRRLTRAQRTVKRVIDVVLALAFLIVMAPLMALIAAAIRITSGPGIIFRQSRVGEAGRKFKIYKFRTMVHGAEDMLDELRPANDAEGLLFKIERDPRVTPLGRFLRRAALDELPQLWNVLKGDMSMVGPRPPLVSEVERYDLDLARRLEVRPGLTGLWQVSGRHELHFADYIRYDLFYVNNWSIGLDLMICARTVPALLNRRGSY